MALSQMFDSVQEKHLNSPGKTQNIVDFFHNMKSFVTFEITITLIYIPQSLDITDNSCVRPVIL